MIGVAGRPAGDDQGVRPEDDGRRGRDGVRPALGVRIPASENPHWN